jgi:hypothetical protein
MAAASIGVVSPIAEVASTNRDFTETKEENNTKKSKYLIDKIIASGLEPFITPDPLPPIKTSDIELLVGWRFLHHRKIVSPLYC